jgi:hypothetical protein
VVENPRDNRKRPRVEAVNDDLLFHLRLCRLGYAKSVDEAAEFDARTVLQILAYEEFCDDYERAYWELNQ